MHFGQGALRPLSECCAPRANRPGAAPVAAHSRLAFCLNFAVGVSSCLHDKQRFAGNITKASLRGARAQNRHLRANPCACIAACARARPHLSVDRRFGRLVSVNRLPIVRESGVQLPSRHAGCPLPSYLEVLSRLWTDKGRSSISHLHRAGQAHFARRTALHVSSSMADSAPTEMRHPQGASIRRIVHASAYFISFLFLQGRSAPCVQHCVISRQLLVEVARFLGEGAGGWAHLVGSSASHQPISQEVLDALSYACVSLVRL
jgi:hypothetical protein